MLRSMLWALILTGFAAMPAGAGEWPRFRGPAANGLTSEDQLPLKWNADENIAWKFKLPGQGWSSPIVWGNKLFVTTAVTDNPPKAANYRRNRNRKAGGGNRANRGKGRRRPRGASRRTPPDSVYRFEVYCLDYSTGDVLWNKLAKEGKPSIPTHHSNTYASETPVTDGERVYAVFGMTGLFCYDFDGNLVWEKALDAFPMKAGWGTSSSPVLSGDHLFLQIDNEKKSFLVALDKKTGDESWQVPREERSNWSTPVVWKTEQRTELVVGGRTVRSYDPMTGDVLWQLHMGGGRSSASPVIEGDRLYVGTEERNRGGYDDGGGTLFAVAAGASGDITPEEGQTTSEGVLWSTPKTGMSMASPLVYQDHVYVLERRSGLANCFDAETGEPVYKRKRVSGARAFWASPWAYDGKVFCLDDTGTTHVLQGGSEFKVLGKNTIEDRFWASSAIADGKLVLRGVDYLYCIER